MPARAGILESENEIPACAGMTILARFWLTISATGSQAPRAAANRAAGNPWVTLVRRQKRFLIRGAALGFGSDGEPGREMEVTSTRQA